MKKYDLEYFLKSSLSVPLFQLALETFLQEEEILKLPAEHKIAYKAWEYFLRKKLKMYEPGHVLWRTHEPLRQFLELWRLQDSALPLLLSRYRFHKKGGIELRKQELKEAGLEFFSKIIGIKTASSYSKYGLRWDNAVQIPYIRLAYRDDQPFKYEIEYFLHRTLKEAYRSSPAFLLVGTQSVKTKVESLWNSRVEVSNPIRLSRGLYAVTMSCPQAVSSVQSTTDETRIGRHALGVTGSIFSIYQLYAAIFPQKIKSSLASPIQSTLSDQTFPKYFLEGQDLIASYLLESLKMCEKLLNENQIKFNPSFATSINYLKQYIAWMKMYKKDYERFSFVFEMAFEEICLFLMMGKRYSKRDYKTILDNSYVVPQTFTKQHFFMSSGMDALTIATIAALKDHPDSGVHICEGNYFELEQCFQYSVKKAKLAENIVLFNLNTTSYFESKTSLSDIEAWLSAQEKDKLVTLIVDHTLESPISLESLFKVVTPWIEAGVLNLVLCKSQQKYTGFGLAKVMSGNITVINQSESFNESIKFLNEVDEGNDYYKKPEFQIMACQLELNAKLDFEKKATLLSYNKAKFISSMCPDVFKDASSKFFLYMFYPVELKSEINHLVDANGLESRESFGFLRCSCSVIDDPKPCLRINVGFEPNERLVEKLYNFSILKKYGLDPNKLHLLLTTMLNSLKITNERYLHNKVASVFVLLLLSLNKHQLEPDLEKSLDAIYKNFIHCSPYVTQEQKRRIICSLFQYKINNASAEQQALNALRQVYFSLSKEEIFKVLRSLSKTKESFYLLLVKEMVKNNNLVGILREEISFFMERDQFVFATELLKFFLEEYKEKCSPDFDMKDTLKSYLKYVLDFHLRKTEPALEENYLQLSRVIYTHYPEFFKSPTFNVLKEALAKTLEPPVEEISFSL